MGRQDGEVRLETGGGDEDLLSINVEESHDAMPGVGRR